MTDHTSESPDGGWWAACGHDGGDGVFGICPTCYRDRMTRLMCHAQGLAVPCCGQFDTCKLACVPRGREEGRREMMDEVDDLRAKLAAAKARNAEATDLLRSVYRVIPTPGGDHWIERRDAFLGSDPKPQ